ncbi:MAG: hypothetical protein ACP5XB_06625 [Isosphaeraceae bacterium]|jgi:hypothetical protein
MIKLIAVGISSVVAIGLAGLFQPPPPPGGEEPPPKAKGKKGAPGDELRKTYDLLRRIRAEDRPGHIEERITDWTDRATHLYRKAIQSHERGERRQAREFSIAAHDLARAVDHARHAARFDRPDPDLPLPPDGLGPEDVGERTRRDLYHAYDRIRDADIHRADASARFYLDAARDLYNAARRDAEDGRDERAGELARAAEAMTHVPEHLRRAGEDGPEAEPKKKEGPRERGLLEPPKAKGERPDHRERGADLPPPLR